MEYEKSSLGIDIFTLLRPGLLCKTPRCPNLDIITSYSQNGKIVKPSQLVAPKMNFKMNLSIIESELVPKNGN